MELRPCVTRSRAPSSEELRCSLTWDQGAEMAQHDRLRSRGCRGLLAHWCSRCRAAMGFVDRRSARQCRQFLRQRTRRKHQRPLQGRGDPSAWAAEIRGRRVRHGRLGRLVQQSPAAWRKPRSATTPCWKRRPPANPARFTKHVQSL